MSTKASTAALDQRSERLSSPSFAHRATRLAVIESKETAESWPEGHSSHR